MLILLPVLALALLFTHFWARGNPTRRSALLAAVLWGVLLWAITQTLSLFHSLQWQWVAVAWAVIVLAALLFLIPQKKALFERLHRPRPPTGLRSGEWFLVSLIVLSVLILAVVARRSPPINWDSYTYHLPRVAHWIQEKSVAFFPTHIPRQDCQPPFAEYIILHGMLLCGSDNWANFVQWSCMLGSILGVSWLAALMGAKARGQLFAAVICATIPMGILQSVSTQNDYVAAFWLLTAIALGWEALRSRPASVDGESTRLPRPPWGWIAAAGAALGLAMLTKASAYLFAFPFCILFALGAWRYRLRAVPVLLLAGALALTINLPHYIRNFRLSGYPLGPPREAVVGSYTNDSFNWRPLTSNAIRNLAIELNTPSRPLNDRIDRAVRTMHRWLGLNPDNVHWTWARMRFTMPNFWRNGDFAGSPLQVLLLLACIPLILLLKGKQRITLLVYFAAVLVGAAFFCLVLKWQPWHNRLLLPLLVLGCPVSAVVLESIWPRWAVAAALAVMIVYAGAVLTRNTDQHLFGDESIFASSRMSQRFRRRQDVRATYRRLARTIHAGGYRRIGFLTNNNGVEYPLWVMLRKYAPGVRLEHMRVHNFTELLAHQPPFSDYVPDVWVRMNSLEDVKIVPPPGGLWR